MAGDAVPAEAADAADKPAAAPAPGAKYQRDENGRFIVPLKKHITFGSQTITELRFREPKTGDLRGIPLQALMSDHLMNVAGKVCGQPSTIIDELSIADALEIGALIADFLPDGLVTGFRA